MIIFKQFHKISMVFFFCFFFNPMSFFSKFLNYFKDHLNPLDYFELIFLTVLFPSIEKKLFVLSKNLSSCETKKSGLENWLAQTMKQISQQFTIQFPKINFRPKIFISNSNIQKSFKYFDMFSWIYEACPALNPN